MLKLSHKDLETIGEHSIIGALAEKSLLKKGEPITISFQQRNLDQCREHDGPEFILIPEYVPGCLLRDIISLMRQGYDIRITEHIKEE